MRTCRRCNGIYSDEFFISHSRSRAAARERYKDKICIGCQQHERDTQKRASRPREKARRTIRTHAEKYILSGTVKTKEEFTNRFGWDVDQIAHDISHAFKNGCQYCHELFSSMGNGLSDVTLDIINPEGLPYYTTNTKWVCGTCNRAKQRKSPEEWGERMRNMDLWKRQIEKLKVHQYSGLPIFDHIKIK